MAAAKPLKVVTTTGKVTQMASTDVIPIANLATGTPDGTKFIRDDGTLVTALTSSKNPATRLFMYFNFS